MSDNNELNLNIDEYDYYDLLQIFSLNNIQDRKELIKIYDHVKLIEDNYDGDANIIIFYKKAFKIIEVINQIFDCNLDKYKDFYKIQDYLIKIKKIDNFYDLPYNEIIQMLPIINDQENNSKNSIPEYETSNQSTVQDPTPQKNINQVFSSPITYGDINYLQRRTQTFNLHINTSYRDKYFMTDPCNYLYVLPDKIKNVISLKLSSIELPNSWFLFSEKKKNNYFIIVVNYSEERFIYKIVIPDGNYDYKSIQDFLNQEYFYLSSNNDTHLKYLKFSIDPINYKSKIETINQEQLLYKFKYDVVLIDPEETKIELNETLGWLLGFRLGNYLNITDKIISEALFDGGGDRYLYFSLNDYQFNNNLDNLVALHNNYLEDHILSKIPVVDGKLSILMDDTLNINNKKRIYNGPVDIARLYIKLLDKDGNIIDLNNMDFSFSLELEILYEKF